LKTLYPSANAPKVALQEQRIYILTEVEEEECFKKK
jgi:hypothetical protein